MPYQVSQLLKDLGAPVSAAPDEPLGEALGRMLQHGFSQLPVVKGTGQERQFYFVTHESILLALHNFGSRIEGSGLRVDDALVKVAKVYAAADDLFDLLVGMRDTNAAVIVDDDRNLTNVVTSYDTSQYFRQWAEDIMHVRDIEHSLRRVINFSFRKSNGEIDEDARRSAVEEMTASNRALRKKFGLAVSYYMAAQAAVTPEMKPESVDLAFLELVKDCRNAATPEPAVAENVANQTDSNAPSSREDEVAGQMDASRALRSRFEVGLQSYLNQQARNVTVDETALEARI
jgi:CBS domain-containing protein